MLGQDGYGHDTDVNPREGCIAPDIAFIAWTTHAHKERACVSRGCRRQDGYGHDMLCGSKGEPLSVERLTRLLLSVELLLIIVAFPTTNHRQTSLRQAPGCLQPNGTEESPIQYPQQVTVFL